jgi:hypothetical protein
MTTESITFDIDDYNTWQQGTRVSLILDPEARKVYTFASVGNNSWPMSVHHRLHRTLATYDQSVSAESLQEWLEADEGRLLAIVTKYEGSEWDGSNHVGSWSDEEDDRRLDDELSDELTQDISSGAIATYWSASEYYSETEGEALEAVLRLGSIEKAAKQEVAAADNSGHLLDQADVETALRAILEGARDYQLDEDDENDAKTLAKIERVLAA